MRSYEYFDRLASILASIRDSQMAAIQEAGHIVAVSVSSGGVLHAFGSGHSHIMAEEAFFRAGGLAPVNPILDARLQFFHGALESTSAERRTGYAAGILAREELRPEDVAIVISNSGRNAVPVEMAEEMKSRGLKVIAITNVRQSEASPARTASGKRLFEVADLAIDNCVPPGDAVLELPGTAGKIGPASTVSGAAIINAIMIEAALELIRMGLPVPLLPSANTASSDEPLTAILQRYSPRIRYFQENPPSQEPIP